MKGDWLLSCTAKAGTTVENRKRITFSLMDAILSGTEGCNVPCPSASYAAAPGLEPGRIFGPGKTDPAGLPGAEAVSPPLHGRRTFRPQPANHRARERGLCAASGLQPCALAEPSSFSGCF